MGYVIILGAGAETGGPLPTVTGTADRSPVTMRYLRYSSGTRTTLPMDSPAGPTPMLLLLT